MPDNALTDKCFRYGVVGMLLFFRQFIIPLTARQLRDYKFITQQPSVSGLGFLFNLADASVHTLHQNFA